MDYLGYVERDVVAHPQNTHAQPLVRPIFDPCATCRAQRSVSQVVLLVVALGPGALLFLVLMSFHAFFRGRMYLCVQLTAEAANLWHLLVLWLWGRETKSRAARRRSNAGVSSQGNSGFQNTSAAVDSSGGGTWFAGSNKTARVLPTITASDVDAERDASSSALGEGGSSAASAEQLETDSDDHRGT